MACFDNYGYLDLMEIQNVSHVFSLSLLFINRLIKNLSVSIH